MLSNALSICPDKIIFVQDKIKIVLDKIIFFQDKKFCPKLNNHFSYNSSLMMNFLSMYKIFFFRTKDNLSEKILILSRIRIILSAQMDWALVSFKIVCPN